MTKDAKFEDFKLKILTKEKLSIKKFFDEDKPINDGKKLKNYDMFTCEMDPNIKFII